MKALYFFDGEFRLTIWKKSTSLKALRVDLMEQLNILAKHEKANEYQPTMNVKDGFHFYVKEENGTETKRCFFIGDFWKSEKRSLLNKHEAVKLMKEKHLCNPDIDTASYFVLTDMA